jgi:hypothetical protein
MARPVPPALDIQRASVPTTAARSANPPIRFGHIGRRI